MVICHRALSACESTSVAEAGAYSGKIQREGWDIQTCGWTRQAEVTPAALLGDTGMLRIEIQAAFHACAGGVLAPDVEAWRCCGLLSALAELRYCPVLLDRR